MSSRIYRDAWVDKPALLYIQIIARQMKATLDSWGSGKFYLIAILGIPPLTRSKSISLPFAVR